MSESFIQTRYWGLLPSAELDLQIADSSKRLAPLRDRIEYCQLQVGRWALHHDQGHLFRATLSIEPAGGGATIALEEETEVDAPNEARAAVLETLFKRAASRLTRA